jgi:hypothetical protein
LCPRKNSRLLSNQAGANFSSCFAPDTATHHPPIIGTFTSTVAP